MVLSYHLVLGSVKVTLISGQQAVALAIAKGDGHGFSLSSQPQDFFFSLILSRNAKSVLITNRYCYNVFMIEV